MGGFLSHSLPVLPLQAYKRYLDILKYHTWEYSSEYYFDPVAAQASKRKRGRYSWVDISGRAADAPCGSAPKPAEVLAGIRLPDFNALRFRDPDSFVAGSLHEQRDVWDLVLAECLGISAQVRIWLHSGVDLYEFFQPFQGTYRGRNFKSDTPPHMYFPNAPVCRQYVHFINDTIIKRLIEGSVELLGAVNEVSPPRCVNALSVEPSKPRLILSMKGPNLWCKDTPFKLVPLGDIAKSINKGGFFSATDDAQGYKQIFLTERSKTFCGFEWAGFFFVDSTLPFGFKNSAYIYSTMGFCLSNWLKNRGIHTEVWIDDRFVGEAYRN